MKKLLLPLALAVLAADLGASTVDLTPRYLDTKIDGFAARRLYFMEATKKIGISLDMETTVAATSAGVVFKFTMLPDTSFRIGTSPLTPEESMTDPEGLARYRAAANNFVPAGATDAKILEEVTNPLPINSWRSQRFVLSYRAGANVTNMSVTFLNVNPESQLVLVTTASPRSFADAADRSFQIIRSWHEVLPGDELALQGN